MTGEDFRPYFDEIIGGVTDGVMIVSPDGVIRMANAAMARMTGFKVEELVGASCTILECDACEILRSASEEKWCRLFEREVVSNKRCIVTRKDGSYVSVIKNAKLLKDQDGCVVGALEFYIDITDIENKDIKIEELTRLLNNDHGFHGMLGMSRAMQEVFQILHKAARSDATILITGETGSGKELVARAIHELGRRKDGPYVRINCAALNESLIESELFGHMKGAFTGAHRHRQGLFEIADGGDIFLDEVGDIPLGTQAKLLRVLETKEFIRIGGERPICVDVRFITATNQDLAKLVAEERFRQDLFFRINVFPIAVPPLRERREDIALLVNSFLHDLRDTSGKRISGVTPEVMDLLMRYEWPGNVRELKSTLEYGVAIASSGLIDLEHLPTQFRPLIESGYDGHPHPGPRPESADVPEKQALIAALRKAHGNQTRAAKLLGVHRMTVLNRMRKYGIWLPEVLRG
jgi:PAS domain S-box-containing protein